MRTCWVLLFLGFIACAGGPGQAAVESASVSLDSPSASLPALTVAWALDVGGRGTQQIRDVAAGSTRSFLVGNWMQKIDLDEGPTRTATDAAEHPFVAAIDASGQPIWLRAFPAVGEITRAVGTREEDVVVSGTRAAAENIGCGPIPQPGGFLAKYDGATGLCLWMRVWPSSQSYSISAVKTEPNGDLVVAGTFAGTLDLGNGHVVVNASANPQVFLARLDARGHALWANVLGDPSASGTVVITATDLATDESGNVFVAGENQGSATIGIQPSDSGPDSPNVYLGEFDANGRPVGTAMYAATRWGPVAVDTRGGELVLVGAVFVDGLSVMASGFTGPRWSQLFSGTAAIEAGKVVVDEAGDVTVVGTFSDGDIVVGDSTFVASGASSQRAISVVLNPSDGAVLAANAWGDDGARVEDTRLSFGQTGLRLMTVDLVGPNHLGSIAIGSADPVDQDGAVLDFTPQSPPGTTPAFQAVWTKPVAGPGDQDVNDVAAGATRSFFLGDGVSPLSRGRAGQFVAAVDANGGTLWSRGFDFGVFFGHVIATPEDDAIVLGSRTGTQDVGCGPITTTGDDLGSTFLVKYAGASGLCLWMRVWPSSGSFGVEHVAMEPNDELAVTGHFTGTVDLGGGNVIVNDSTVAQVFVARLSSRGHAIWTRVLGDPSAGSSTNILADGLATDESGNLYITGRTYLRTDFDGDIVDLGTDTFPTYVLSIDGTGAFRWLYLDTKSEIEPTSIDARGGQVAVLAQRGQPFVFAGETIPGNNGVVLDFDLDGRQRWASFFQVIMSDEVAIDVDGAVAVVGTFASPAQIDQPNTTVLQLGRQSFVPYGTPDIGVRAGSDPAYGFVAVLDGADGQIVRATTFGSAVAFVFTPRISLGPTGLKLMSMSVSGIAPIGGLTIGQPVSTGEFDGVVMGLGR